VYEQYELSLLVIQTIYVFLELARKRREVWREDVGCRGLGADKIRPFQTCTTIVHF